MELENSLLKTPVELANKKVRLDHKCLDTEFHAALSSVTALRKNPAAKTKEGAALAVETLEGVVNRLGALKRKMSAQDESHLDRALSRVAHLEELQTSTANGDAEALECWGQTRLNRAIVDFCLREGFEETATELTSLHNMEALVDAGVFSEAKAIVAALRSRKCGPALVWCSENRARLKKSESPLELLLRVQEVVELYRAGSLLKSVAYTRKHIAPMSATYPDEIRRVMGMLAFPADAEFNPYRLLLSSDRWEVLVTEFNKATLAVHSLPAVAPLHTLVRAGLSALQSRECSQHDRHNVQCPTCDEQLGKAASEAHIPVARHAHSQLVCRISGQVMNEHNPPMAFPNGQVYSEKALKAMVASRADNNVVCPVTGELCEFGSLKRAFIS